MNSYIETLDRIEHDIIRYGVAGREAELGQIAELLVRTSTLPVIAGILADPDESEPARLRAFARASAALRHAAVVRPTVTTAA